MDTCIITRVQLDTSILYSCPNGHVSLIRVSTMDTPIKYTCQNGHVYYYTCPFFTHLQFDTCLLRHVSNLTRVYSNGYCRHVSNCSNFCSGVTPERENGENKFLGWFNLRGLRLLLAVVQGLHFSSYQFHFTSL
jgi:hypothetical protein